MARVLLATGREDLRTQVLALFAEMGEQIDTIGVAEDSAALLLAVDAQPDIDIVFIDDSIGPLPFAALVREVLTRVPHIGVVVRSDHATPATFQDAMNAGARAIVESPPSIGDLIDRLPAILAWQRQLRGALQQTGSFDEAGRMIAFVGSKGGVGTTTLAVHTALTAALVNPERKVALVDLDLQQRGVTQVIEVSSRRTISDLVTLSESLTGRNIDEATTLHKSGLRILLAPEQGESAEDIDGQVARQILAACKGHYDVVILDCGSVVTEASAVGMEFAEDLLLVATPNVASLRAAQDKHDLLNRLQIVKDSSIQLLFNKVSRTYEVQPEFGARMAIANVQRVHIPEDWKNLEQTANALAPLDLQDSPFRRAISTLTHNLELDTSAPVPAPVVEVEGAQATETRERSKRGRRRLRTRTEAGQVTIDTVVGLAVAMVILLVVVQVGLMALGTVAARRAADEAARVDTRGGSLTDARSAAEGKIPSFYGLAVTKTGDGTFTTTVTTPRLVPFIPGDVSAKSSAAEEG